MKYLIVNADDFGLTPGINAGIVTAHEQGIVSSTTLMVHGAAAEEAAAWARARPALGVPDLHYSGLSAHCPNEHSDHHDTPVHPR